MARRNKGIIKNTTELASVSISAFKNLAVIADNLTGMMADGSDVVRDSTPSYISKQIAKAAKVSELEDQLELLELQAQINELTPEPAEPESVEPEPAEPATKSN